MDRPPIVRFVVQGETTEEALVRGYPRLIEPDYIETIFITGIMPPENLGDVFRITAYEDRPLHGARIVRLKVAMAADNFRVAARTAFEAGMSPRPTGILRLR